MRLSNNLVVVLGALPIATVVAIPLGEPSLIKPRQLNSLQPRAPVPPPSTCETGDNITPWGTVETCGPPPVPKNHPSLSGAKGPRDFVTIITEADVTWCRPWPNSVIPAAGAQLFKWTSLNLTCWTPTDRTVGKNGNPTKDAADLWVKTGDQGCYINENDLRAHDVDFVQYLKKCRAFNGAHPLEPNPGPLIVGGVSAITGSPAPTVKPDTVVPAASASPASIPLPVPVIPVANPAPASDPKPAEVKPTAGSAVAASPSPAAATGATPASIPAGPQPERATPRPDATALKETPSAPQAAPKSGGMGGVANIPAVVAKTVSSAPWATPAVLLPNAGSAAKTPDVVSKTVTVSVTVTVTVTGAVPPPAVASLPILNPQNPAIRGDSVW